MNFTNLTLLSVGRLPQTNRFIEASEGFDPTLCHAVDKVDGVDGNNPSPNKHVWLYPTAAISEGDWVMLTVGTTTNGIGRHIEKSSGADEALVFGVAEESASGASTTTPIKVCIAGRPDTTSVAVATGTAVGAILTSGSTAGQAVLAADLEGEIVCGINMATPASNVSAAVLVYDRGWFG